MANLAEQTLVGHRNRPLGPLSPKVKLLSDFIVEGEIKIESIEAFSCVLKQFPDHAGLHKMHADLLLEKNLRYAAAKAYAQASDLFIDAGRILQAVSAKMSQWDIIPSSDEENSHFLAQIKNGDFPQSPVKSFFSRLTDEELMAVFSSLERSHYTTGTTIKAPNDEEKDLFLVVYGTLRESTRQVADASIDSKKSPTVLLGSEDCFGDIYPFAETKMSRSYIEAISQVELIKLPKEKLQILCRQHRNIEVGLVDLCKVRAESGAEGLSQMIRECGRYENLVCVSLEVYPTATQGYPLTLEAYAQDISIGGIRLVLSSQDAVIPTLISSYRKTLLNTKARVGLPEEKLSLKIAGNIVWCRPVCVEDKQTLVLGIRFEDMSPKLRGMFFGFVEGFGEKN